MLLQVESQIARDGGSDVHDGLSSLPARETRFLDGSSGTPLIVSSSSTPLGAYVGIIVFYKLISIVYLMLSFCVLGLHNSGTLEVFSREFTCTTV